MPDLAIELQKIYGSEINIRLSWLWDAGIEIRLGDGMNGYLAEQTVQSTAEVVPWLQEAIAHSYPESTYAASPQFGCPRSRPALFFQPPKMGASVVCPHCGAPHAAPPGMDELLARSPQI